MSTITRDQQPREALRAANRRRQAGIEFRVRVAKAAYPVELVRRLLDYGGDPDEEAQRVGPLLQAIPRVGATKSGRMLAHAGIGNASLHVRDLTRRQRRDLALALGLPFGDLRARPTSEVHVRTRRPPSPTERAAAVEVLSHWLPPRVVDQAAREALEAAWCADAGR